MSNRLFLALVVLSVFFTRPVASYTSYTDPKSFEADIMHYIGHTSENFDDQTLGSPASDYGILAIHPTGLKSDGIEPVKLKPIATSDYPGCLLYTSQERDGTRKAAGKRVSWVSDDEVLPSRPFGAPSPAAASGFAALRRDMHAGEGRSRAGRCR